MTDKRRWGQRTVIESRISKEQHRWADVKPNGHSSFMEEAREACLEQASFFWVRGLTTSKFMGAALLVCDDSGRELWLRMRNEAVSRIFFVP